jgi:hypothetical protein
MFASAFKGANGIVQQFADIGHYTSNLASYKKLYYENKKVSFNMRNFQLFFNIGEQDSKYFAFNTMQIYLFVSLFIEP